MKKYFFRFAIALLAFSIGLASSRGIDFFLYKFLLGPEIKEDLVQVQQPKENQEIKFQGTACGTDSFGNSFTNSFFVLPDGTTLSSMLITRLKSEKSARKRFNHELKTATRIIEVVPYLDYWKRKLGEKAFVESGGKVIIIKYWKNPSSINENEHYMSIIENQSLQEARNTDEEAESFERSLIVNKLKP